MKSKLAAIIIGIIGLWVCISAQAGSVRFTGVVTSVIDTTLPIHVGDLFQATVFYNNRTHVITRTNVHINVLYFSYPEEGTSFTFQDDPCHCFVSYQVSQSGPAHLTLQLFGVTNGSCVFPALPEFTVNEWTFFQNGQTSGVLTEIPEIHP